MFQRPATPPPRLDPVPDPTDRSGLSRPLHHRMGSTQPRHRTAHGRAPPAGRRSCASVASALSRSPAGVEARRLPCQAGNLPCLGEGGRSSHVLHRPDHRSAHRRQPRTSARSASVPSSDSSASRRLPAPTFGIDRVHGHRGADHVDRGACHRGWWPPPPPRRAPTTTAATARTRPPRCRGGRRSSAALPP